MTAEIIEFPTLDQTPDPFQPSPAVRRHLATNKCNACLRIRITSELSDYLDRWAVASDKTKSALACRLLLERVLIPRESCPPQMKMAGRRREDRQEKAA